MEAKQKNIKPLNNSKHLETTKTLFVNMAAVEWELNEIQKTLQDVKRVKQYLIDSDVLVTPETILQGCRGQFHAIIALSKEPELKAMQDFNSKVGSNEILNEMTMQRINEKGEKLNQKLLSGLPAMGQWAKHYLQYINCESMSIVDGVREIFTEKHSIKADIETVTHLENLVNSINYFFQLYPTHSIKVILERLYRIDEFKRTCEMKLDYFDPEKIVRDWISLRVNNML